MTMRFYILNGICSLCCSCKKKAQMKLESEKSENTDEKEKNN